MGSKMSTMGNTRHKLGGSAVVSLCLAFVTAQRGPGNHNQFVDFGGRNSQLRALLGPGEDRQSKALLGPGGHAVHAHVSLPQDIGNRDVRQYQDLSHGSDDFSQGDFQDIGHYEEYHDFGHEAHLNTGNGEAYHQENVQHEQHCTIVQEEQCTQLTEEHCTQTQRQTCLDIPISSCEAHTVEECMDIPEQECETKSHPMCVETYVHECTVEHDTVVETHCKTVPGEKCFHFDEQICKQVPDKVCTTVTDVVCEEIEEEYCGTYFDVSIGKECIEFNEAVCETVSTKIRTTVNEQQCSSVGGSIGCSSKPRKVVNQSRNKNADL